MKMFDLTGKTAIVTGGGSGIGRAIAVALASQGAAVCILDLNIALANEVVEEITNAGGVASFVPCDVSDADKVAKAFKEATNGQPLDILINNAGIAHVGNIANTTPHDFDKIIAVNVKGVYNSARASISHMHT
jgi:NAD(P)-dependent dehydrogenase (short-subunit alcohol dehydrogenase family)